MADLKIGIVGCAGRMGLTLARQIHATAGCRIAGGTEHPDNAALGKDLGGLAGLGDIGLDVGTDAPALFAQSDVVVDFTAPAATARHVALAAETGTAMVIGTTGLDAAQEAAVGGAAEAVAIVKAGNMSLGVNLLTRLVADVARALQEDFDVEVVEMHHRHKVDAPSGTALMLGRAVAEGRGQDHDAAAVFARHGHTGARPQGAIGYAALRGGNVVGEHTVIFAADDERIELTHRAGDRTIFARGAVRAALWTRGRPAGLYDMIDVLGLRSG